MSSHRYADELAHLPSDWHVEPVESVADVVGGSTPSRNVPRYWNGDLPWVTPGELTGLKTKFLGDTRDHLTRAGLEACGARLLPANTLLVTSRATLGAVALVRHPTATNQGFKSLVFNAHADASFFFHAFQRLRPELTRRASGTTFLEVSGREFAQVRLAVPAVAEQRGIAEILDTLDETIRKTEQLITKLKQLKQGLLHDLLTRGIDDNGELRDPERNPEQFEESALGPIPKTWAVRQVRDIAAEPLINGVFKQPSRVGRGVPLVNVGDLYTPFGVDLNGVESFDASRAELHRFAVVPGDIYFTRSSLNLAGIAHCNVVRRISGPAVFECHVMRLRVNRTAAVPEYVAHWCRAFRARAFLMGRAKQVTMTTIAQPDIEPLPLPVPEKAEQERVVATIDGVDERLRREGAVVAKLRSTRLALMDDLLTGRVRAMPKGSEEAA